MQILYDNHQSKSDQICHLSNRQHYTLKMLGCFNPTLGQIWTNPNVGLKKLQLNVKVEVGLKFEIQFLGLSIFTQIWVKTTLLF